MTKSFQLLLWDDGLWPAGLGAVGRTGWRDHMPNGSGLKGLHGMMALGGGMRRGLVGCMAERRCGRCVEPQFFGTSGVVT